MIVNARRTLYVIVELSAEDMQTILEGHEVIRESRAAGDQEVLVRVYCDHPEDVKK